jgi:hypothetical protein
VKPPLREDDTEDDPTARERHEFSAAPALRKRRRATLTRALQKGKKRTKNRGLLGLERYVVCLNWVRAIYRMRVALHPGT